MSCVFDSYDKNILICSDNNATTYIKNISTVYGSDVYVPAYKTIPNNCVYNKRDDSIAYCLEYLDPDAISTNSNIPIYSITKLTKSGNYYVQNPPQDPSEFNTIAYKNKNDTDLNAPMCLVDIDKCAYVDVSCPSICIGKNGVNYNSVYN